MKPRRSSIIAGDGRLAGKRPESILVVRPGAMGDVLLTTPVLRALKIAFPASLLAALVTRPGKEILSQNPDLDEIMVLDKSSWRPQVEIVGAVRRKKFELVLDFLCNPRTALITFLSGAPFRVGYGVGLRRFAYNVVKPRDEFRDGKKVAKYAAEVNLDVVRYLGIKAVDPRLHFSVGDAPRRVIREFLASHGLDPGKFVCVSASGSWPAKTWEVEKFAVLADMITARFGLRVVIVWGPGERGLAEAMSSLMKTRGLVACQTSIAEAGALVENCAVLVSNDSGLKHIAVAVGTPTVTIFGPTNPVTWNPASSRHRAVSADVQCLYCDKNKCETMYCMKELSAEKVFGVVREVLEEIGRYGQGTA
jgi:lipopolysaccharide heptosyltransferase II